MDDDVPRANVPADIGTPDKIAWGLTFRQLAIIGTAVGTGWLLYSNFGPLLPPIVWVIAAIPIAAATGFVALGRRDGLPLDVWLRHGLALRRVPTPQTPGSTYGGQPLVRTAAPPQVPAPLRTAATSIADDGTITVDGTTRCVIACGTTNVALRTGKEQAALLAGFGAWLNALDGPAQIVVAAQRHDLIPYAQAVADNAARLPSEALRAAADDYAAFLLDLDATRSPLRRQVLAVVPAGPTTEATARAFGALGVSAEPLDGGDTTGPDEGDPEWRTAISAAEDAKTALSDRERTAVAVAAGYFAVGSRRVGARSARAAASTRNCVRPTLGCRESRPSSPKPASPNASATGSPPLCSELTAQESGTV